MCARDSGRVREDFVTRGGKEQCTTVSRVDTVVIAQVWAGFASEQSCLRAQQVGGRECSECAWCRGGSQPGGECLREFFGELEPAGHLVVSALDDRSLEQSGGQRGAQQERDRGAASRFAEDGDVVRVPAEPGDVVANPVQCCDLIAQSDVRDLTGQCEEALRPESVVDGDQDDAVARERDAVEGGGGARADHEPAAVDVDHHRKPTRAGVGCPDVEIEVVAVSGDPSRSDQRRQIRVSGVQSRLGCGSAVTGGVPGPCPSFGRARGCESAFARWSCRVGDSQEAGDPVGVVTGESPCLCVHGMDGHQRRPLSYVRITLDGRGRGWSFEIGTPHWPAIGGIGSSSRGRS